MGKEKGGLHKNETPGHKERLQIIQEYITKYGFPQDLTDEQVMEKVRLISDMSKKYEEQKK